MILEKIKGTIKKHALIKNNDRIVVGVSGGPDSVVLLYALNSFKKEFALRLHIAHLDHMLRSDSNKDRELVEKLAEKLSLPVTVASVNVKKVGQKGSLEEIARKARFDFFFKVAKKLRTNKIALGHTFDDQAETVLMRILRGSGLYGLSAILPKRTISGFQIIRPLIEIRRKEIEAFLKRKKISSRIDFSNTKDIYLRNKIRNKLLPYLEKEYNRNIKEVLANMAQTSASDYDYLSSAAELILMKYSRGFPLEKLKKLHPAIRRLLFRKAIARLKGDTRRINFRHINEIEDLLLNRPENSIVDLPKGVSVVKKKRLLFYT